MSELMNLVNLFMGFPRLILIFCSKRRFLHKYYLFWGVFWRSKFTSSPAPFFSNRFITNITNLLLKTSKKSEYMYIGELIWGLFPSLDMWLVNSNDFR